MRVFRSFNKVNIILFFTDPMNIRSSSVFRELFQILTNNTININIEKIYF